MTQFKILITDDVHPLLLEGLERRGFITDYLPEISLEQTREIIDSYTGLVINSKIKVDSSFFDKARNLRWIARLGSGMEIIDAKAAEMHGVRLISAPEGNCNAVAEHALGALLALFRNLVRADQEVRKGIWDREKNRGEELSGKTVGVIGFGHTGSRFVELLQGLNVKVLVYDKYKQLSSTATRYTVVQDVSEIQESADVISLHVPLTAETKYLLDKEFIAKVKHSFYLINTSRGPVVNTKDLLAALHSGKIRGACLDVFENEKPASFNKEESAFYNDLYRLPQVLLSPHIAGWTYQSKQKIATTILEKLDWIANEKIL